MNPVLLIAWASADWKIAMPLLEAGRMPHLARLIARGAQGNLRTLQPQSPPLQWTALATGMRPDVHRLLGPLMMRDGAVRASGSADRRAPALWNIAEHKGLTACVTNWPCTHPAEPLRGAMLSELFACAGGTPEATTPPLPGSLAAPGLEEVLADMRLPATAIGLDVLSWFVPQAAQLPEGERELLGWLALALARGSSAHAAATLLLVERPASLHMVCYDALAVLGTRFMALHPPRLPFVPQELVERWGQVVPRMYEYLDLQLGRLVELAGEGANILLVSEHGMHSDHLRPQTLERALQRLAAPWLREQGLLVAAGPDIREGVRIEGAELLDIAPTTLALLGLPVAADLPGRVLHHALRATRAPARVASWSHVSAAGQGVSDPDAEAALLEWRAALGEIDAGLLEAEVLQGKAIRAAVEADACFNLAMTYMESARAGLALPLLRGLHEDAPEDERIALHLARCLQATGDLAGAQEMMRGVAEAGPPRPHEHLMLSRMYRQQGEPARALASLFRAEQANPGQPGLHCRIGEVYLQMRRWPDAARAFGKALALEADHAAAHHGMAVVHLAEERYEDAVESALTAVGLAHRSPQAHFHLGVALARTGRAQEAAQAFETCVAQQSGHLAAHEWLARLYRDPLGDAARANEHLSRVGQLQAAALLGNVRRP